MLQSLTIENFKCFEHLELKDLGQFNLITGRNNVGKSSLLEAITLPVSLASQDSFVDLACLREPPKSDFLWKSLFHQFSFDKSISVISDYQNLLNPKQKQHFKLTVDSFSETAQLTLNALLNVLPSNSDSTYKVSKDFSEDFLVALKKVKKSSLEDSIRGLKIKVEDLSRDFMFSHYLLYENKPISFNGQEIELNIKIAGLVNKIWPNINYCSFPMVNSDIQDEFEEVDNKKRLSEIVRVLNEFYSDFKLENITLNRRGYFTCDSKSSVEKFPLSVFGTGYRSAFTLLVIIAVNQNGILLLDEIDNGLHYSSQKKVIHAALELAKKLNVQIFATTHSMECVRAFSEVANEGEGFEARLINLRKPAGDPHEALIYNKADLAELLDDGLELT